MIGNQNKWATIKITLKIINCPNDKDAFPFIQVIFGFCFVVGPCETWIIAQQLVKL
jgi:hypothetical protein